MRRVKKPRTSLPSRLVLAGLALLIVLYAPWRLMVLGVEVLALSPGTSRLSVDTDRYWDAIALEGRLVNMGWSVKYQDGIDIGGSAAYGAMNPYDHTIYIDARQPWNARLAVLYHEGAHVLQPGWVTKGQGEAFAETVAALASHDGFREHARYLAAMKMDFVFMALAEWPAMYHAAAVLEDR